MTAMMLLQWRLCTFNMDSGTLLQDHLDAFNKLVMDLLLLELKRAKNAFMFFVIFIDFKIS